MSNKDLSTIKSLLFTPGTRPDRFGKAVTTAADGLIIDLEDAVGPGDKDSARSGVAEWFRQRTESTRPGFLFCLRVNSPYTEAGLRDLVALVELAKAGCAPDAVLLPKVESAVEVELVARHLRAAGQGGAGVALVGLIESAAGLEQAFSIAGATPMLCALAFGGVDLAADLRAEFTWESLLWGRGRIVQAAASRGLGLLDVPYLGIGDDAGLAAECARVKAMGFGGKLAIHPNQVETIARAFTPTAAEVEHAQGVLAAYTAASGGACTYRGKMVDEPVVIVARQVLARAAA
jgi:citrate lyase beta subunit